MKTVLWVKRGPRTGLVKLELGRDWNEGRPSEVVVRLRLGQKKVKVDERSWKKTIERLLRLDEAFWRVEKFFLV